MNIEKTYKKLEPIEHILLRPDTYIGSVDKITEKYWVWDDSKNKFSYNTITIVPGLFKIFDEILVNAVDNFYRDKKQKYVKVSINPQKNEISVLNDGKGVPIIIHKDHKMYVPELIFGNLLTSSNYDDSEKKIIGGRNGYGAKLANIFSSKFIVETCDLKLKKHYCQEFSNNMQKKDQPVIKEINVNDPNNPYKSDFTKITFYPDLKRFNMKTLENEIVQLMKKRVYDVAGTTPYSLQVYFNGSLLPIREFKDYVDLYLKDEIYNDDVPYPKIYDCPHERWEVMVTLSDNFQQCSFVNNINTSKGGTHVNHITEQIADKVIEHVKKKNKLTMKPQQVKNHLWVFVNSKIENPAFDTQTKENLTSKSANFGSKCELSDKFFKQLLAPSSLVLQNIVSNVKAKETVKLNKALSSTVKKVSRLLGIKKLDDANQAGTKNSLKCCLILTEGDSAKALAMAGIEVVGRDYFGVFPLRGKLLNVRDANNKKLLENEEIQNIIKIMGLHIGKDYSEDNIKSLRYGKIMIMADQDPDGSHIKGLIINFIDFFWPSLIKRNDFLDVFVTPLVKISGNVNLSFYSSNDFKQYFETNKELLKKSKIKYYKGLGTSTTKEAKEYFRDFNKNKLSFLYQNQEDIDKIDLVFNKTKANERKNWLKDFDGKIGLNYNQDLIRYSDFIDKELIYFSTLDNIRSIPSCIDGLKPSERKILYSCFKRKLVNELKVAQLSGYVAEHSAYHHGEQSLCQTIVAMAQDFTGSNNINLLNPIGQFGNRYSGKDGAASARYIYTSLNKITRILFSEQDDGVITYNVEEGLRIEPCFYIPILPLVLVNGSVGIGTGWSTNIPCYNPLDLVECIKQKIEGKDYKTLVPWFKGFKGTVEYKDKDKEKENNNDGTDLSGFNSAQYTVNGVFNINHSDCTIEITELPIGTSISNYKEFLEGCFEASKDGKEKKTEKIEITDLKEGHSENNVYFNILLTEESFQKFTNLNLSQQRKILKLQSGISTGNMVAFDKNNKLKKFLGPSEILNEFFDTRLEYYSKRKKHILGKLGYQYEILANKLKFVELIVNGDIKFNKKKKEVISLLQSKGIVSEDIIKAKYKDSFIVKTTEVELEVDEEKEEDEHIEEKDEKDIKLRGYDYCMNLSFWSLTQDKIENLKEQIAKLKSELNYYQTTSEKQLWNKDLELFQEEYYKLLSFYEDGEKKLKKPIIGKKVEVKKVVKNKKQVSSVSTSSFIDNDDVTQSEQYVPKKPTKRQTKEKQTTILDYSDKKTKNKEVVIELELNEEKDKSQSKTKYSQMSEEEINKLPLRERLQAKMNISTELTTNRNLKTNKDKLNEMDSILDYFTKATESNKNQYNKNNNNNLNEDKKLLGVKKVPAKTNGGTVKTKIILDDDEE